MPTTAPTPTLAKYIHICHAIGGLFHACTVSVILTITMSIKTNSAKQRESLHLEAAVKDPEPGPATPCKT